MPTDPSILVVTCSTENHFTEAIEFDLPPTCANGDPYCTKGQLPPGSPGGTLGEAEMQAAAGSFIEAGSATSAIRECLCA